MDIDEIKKKALALGFTKIQREADNAPIVGLKDWPGFSSHVSGGLYAMVTYGLEGSRVCVHKAGEEGDHWYTLS